MICFIFQLVTGLICKCNLIKIHNMICIFNDMFSLRSSLIFCNTEISSAQYMYVQIIFKQETTISSRIISHRAIWFQAPFAYEGIRQCHPLIKDLRFHMKQRTEQDGRQRVEQKYRRQICLFRLRKHLETSRSTFNPPRTWTADRRT